MRRGLNKAMEFFVGFFEAEIIKNCYPLIIFLPFFYLLLRFGFRSCFMVKTLWGMRRNLNKRGATVPKVIAETRFTKIARRMMIELHDDAQQLNSPCPCTRSDGAEIALLCERCRGELLIVNYNQFGFDKHNSWADIKDAYH
jgi:hypothetical protein